MESRVLLPDSGTADKWLTIVYLRRRSWKARDWWLRDLRVVAWVELRDDYGDDADEDQFLRYAGDCNGTEMQE